MAIDRDLHLNTIVSQDMGSPGQDCMGKNKQLGPECSLQSTPEQKGNVMFYVWMQRIIFVLFFIAFLPEFHFKVVTEFK